MFIRALIAFITLPGIFALLLPPLLVRLDPRAGTCMKPGIVILFIGTCILLWCVRDFYFIGKGTLAPWDPPKKLVVIGLYRVVRNPMYIGVLSVVLGWSVYYWSPLLLLYDIALFTGFHLRVVKYEEPRLREHFGEDWQQYRRRVSRWKPGLSLFK